MYFTEVVKTTISFGPLKSPHAAMIIIWVLIPHDLQALTSAYPPFAKSLVHKLAS